MDGHPRAWSAADSADARRRSRRGFLGRLRRHAPRCLEDRNYAAGAGRAGRAGEGPPRARAPRGDVRGRDRQRVRIAPRPAHRAAQPLGRAGPRRRAGRDAGRARGSRPDGRVQRRCAQRRLRRGGRAGHGCARHRNRRLASRAGDGRAGACARQRRAALPLRLQRRRRRLRRHRGAAGSAPDAGDRRIQDLRHRGDHGQRRRRPRLARRRRRRPGRAVRRRVGQRRKGGGVRHSRRAGVWLWGLGRRALLDLGAGWPAADDRDRRGAVPRLP